MQNQPNHWRKNWPEGIDDATGDSEVLNMFALPEPAKPADPPITYPYTLDEDVIDTGVSLKTAEALTKTKLSDASVVNNGMDMISQYDNNRRVWERNTPYGNEWDKFPRAPAPDKWGRAAEPKAAAPAAAK